ncbi:DNA (cytosine-5-)-methyltransferase [Deinococcus sp. YIM 134068]|uniref:DNA cytosine methyltransferase n=1 Tax=Deinococcus lichenicola TaxID=3118910 RepID=UPI002F955D85
MAEFYEFFAGGGMARAGLGADWTCVFANDFDPRKADVYRANWGEEHLRVADVATLTTADLPGHADLAWASFPCQDLSLAGSGHGLRGSRSGTYWSFHTLIRGLVEEARAPTLITVENVCGAITSHRGEDLRAILRALIDLGYRVGPLVLDAAAFVPQSRARLFILAVRANVPLPPRLHRPSPDPRVHPPALVKAMRALPEEDRPNLVWWDLTPPAPRPRSLADLVEDEPQGVAWHTPEETHALLGMMTPVNRARVEAAAHLGIRQVGTIYRRTRQGVQRAEVRFDGIAGCLRTPTGGSSRQTILLVEGERVRSRLLSPREAARLMGLPDSYQLPPRYNDAYRLAGDGVAAPVVTYLRDQLLGPLLAAAHAAQPGDDAPHHAPQHDAPDHLAHLALGAD